MAGNGEVSFETYRREFLVGLGTQHRILGRAGIAADAFAASYGVVGEILQIRKMPLVGDAQNRIPELATIAYTQADIGARVMMDKAVDYAEVSLAALVAAFGKSDHPDVNITLGLASHQIDAVNMTAKTGDGAHDMLEEMTGDVPDTMLEEARQLLVTAYDLVKPEGGTIHVTAGSILNSVNSYLDTQGIRKIEWSEVNV